MVMWSSYKQPMNMVEVGQPGELPLMPEEPTSASTLKKSKGGGGGGACGRIRDKQSWVVEEAPNSSQGEHGDTQVMRKAEPRSSPRDQITTSTLREEHARKDYSPLMRSPPRPRVRNVGPRELIGIRDIGAESSFMMGMEAGPHSSLRDQTYNNFKDHLESKLGNLSAKSRHIVGGKSILHNWRPTASSSSSSSSCSSDTDDINNAEDEDEDVEENDYGDPEGRFMAPAESFEGTTSMVNMRNWVEFGKEEDYITCRPRQPFPPYHEFEGHEMNHELERLRASGEQGVPTRVGKLSRETAQILSPLALNPHDDLWKFSQSKSFFTLEEPYEGEQNLEQGNHGDSMAASLQRMTSRYPPLMQPEKRKSSKSKSVSMKSNRRNMNSEGSRSRSTSRQLRQGFPEYRNQMAPTESEKSYTIFSNPNVPPKYHYAGQEVVVSPHLEKTTTRRKGGSGSIQTPIAPRGFSQVKRPNSEAEPLPSHDNELEVCGQSGEASSVDDGDGNGMKLEHKAPVEGENTGTIVKVMEKEKTLQLAAMPECKELALCDYKPRNLSQKYRPKGFDEVVGQRIVMQALSNAILKGKIAPVYLFQGSRGTGKTSAARIFAAALVCASTNGKRPCGTCRECMGVAMGKSSEVKEVDAASNNGIEKVKALLEGTISSASLSRYKVFIIDECHALTSETWNALLKTLEEPPTNVVFILITTDPDRLPRTALSRCQKFPFPKIKESDIVKRLHELAGMENLEVDTATLQLIASRSEGSLRDAEMTLDQLSLLGEQIDTSNVYELVGSASDERMLNLLDCALRADTVGTVRRVRELVDSGVEPLSLMSRLATLITEILSGSFRFTEKQRKGFFRKESLSDKKLEWLRQAMKTLSEAEKQLRVSNDRTTWLTAALLQLGPDFQSSTTFPASCTGTSVTQSPVALDDNEVADFECVSSGRRTWEENTNNGPKKSSEPPYTSKEEQKEAPPYQSFERHIQSQMPERRRHYSNDPVHILTTSKLDDIWHQVIQRCWPLTLRQLLHTHGKLISISMTEADAVIHLEVNHPEHKSRCERSQKSIANLFESVLGFPVEMVISLASMSLSEEEPGFHTYVHHHSTQGRVMCANCLCPTNDTTLDHLESMRPNRSDCPLAIPHGSFSSSLKEEKGFLDESTTYWPRRNHDDITRGIDTSYSDGENVFEALALETNASDALSRKPRLRHSRMEGCMDSNDDARKSCDTDMQRSEVGRRKFIRALTMRTRISSLSNSNPTSPDGRGSSRFTISSKAPVNFQKQRDYSCLSGNGASSDASGEVAEYSNNVAQKRNKLKEAAGSFARFFKGSK